MIKELSQAPQKIVRVRIMISKRIETWNDGCHPENFFSGPGASILPERLVGGFPSVFEPFPHRNLSSVSVLPKELDTI
jgi:hypothetical protein